MEVVALSGEDWKAASDFYDAYLAAVGAPEWHGRNFDALWDSLTAGGINELNPPLCIQISGTGKMAPSARQIVRDFESLIIEAKKAGHPVEIELRP